MFTVFLGASFLGEMGCFSEIRYFKELIEGRCYDDVFENIRDYAKENFDKFSWSLDFDNIKCKNNLTLKKYQERLNYGE